MRFRITAHRLARHHPHQHQWHAAAATMCVNATERDDLPPLIYPSKLLHDAILPTNFAEEPYIHSHA
jgi:hypothetical protein